MANNPVVHFEMPYKDKNRLSDFYRQAFNWEMQQMGKEYGGYVMAMTGPSNEQGPLEKGYINGGFYDENDVKPEHRAPSLVISVDNLDEAMKNVQKAGGELIDQPMVIPKVGKYIAIKDTEGNRVGLLQPAGM